MRSRAGRPPAGMPVTMTVSCGPGDSPALTKRKRDMGEDLIAASGAPHPALRATLSPRAGRGIRSSRGARVAAAVLHLGAQRRERIGLDPGDALRGELALDALRAADYAAHPRHVLGRRPSLDDLGTRPEIVERW